MNRPSLRSPRFAIVTGALALTVVAAACGGSSHASTNISSSATTTPRSNAGSSGPSGTGAGGGGGASFPGASGSVAAITGQSMEVQNQQVGQVTVSWTPSTRFSQMVTVPASAVAVGDCITATGTSTNGAIVATSVTISQASSTGSCTGNFGGGARRARPAGSSSSSTFPNSGTRPARTPGAGFDFATGKVTAVTATTLTVDGFSSANFRPGSSTSTTTPTAAPVSVTVKSTTTYHETRTAAASNLAVGDCVTATGSTSSTGAVTASVVRITSTGGQSCTTAGGGRFFGGFGGGGGGTGGTGGGTASNG